MFVAMTVYAMLMPDSLGWGLISLEASFGLLRFDFILVSLAGAILVVHLFTLWKADNVIEAWMEFTEAKLLSAKKALYLELMLQLAVSRPCPRPCPCPCLPRAHAAAGG